MQRRYHLPMIWSDISRLLPHLAWILLTDGLGVHVCLTLCEDRLSVSMHFFHNIALIIIHPSLHSRYSWPVARPNILSILGTAPGRLMRLFQADFWEKRQER